MYKFLILGAGPAGLSFANRLLELGCDNFLVLEKENVAGGLCRSEMVDGSPFDIGGGHFLDVTRPNVNEFLWKFMPKSEWNIFDRKTTLCLDGEFIGQPIEAHIWQMTPEKQVDYIKSIAVAGCNMEKPMPERFVEWIYWKLGKRIADDYMLPYNKKMFGKNLDELGTYWLEKLPNVSFDETLLSCITRKAYGKNPGHTKFYYPKQYGYGEVWKRMAEALGDRIVYGIDAKGIDFSQHKIKTSDGSEYTAEKIVNTIPWVEFEELLGMPADIIKGIKLLKHSSIQTRYYSENLETDAHWIYYPDLELSYHRILVRHNFCPQSRGYWTETNGERIYMEADKESIKFMNKYAYPLNTVGKREIIQHLLNWCAGQSVYGLGRWGEHSHYNSDVTVERALNLANTLM